MRHLILLMLYKLKDLLSSRFYFGTVAEEVRLARRLFNQASVLRKECKYQEAITLLQQSLEIDEKIVGPDHAVIATSISNLAMLHKILGQYDLALPLYQRALVILEKSLGHNHPGIAEILNNLAVLYSNLGQYDKALPLHQRALAIRENVLGPNHPDTAVSLNNFAALYQTLGQYDKTLSLYQRALVIREKALGPDHPDTAFSLDSLAAVLQTLGQYDEALSLARRALAIREKAFGHNHPDTAFSLINLATLHQTFAQYFQDKKARCERILGTDHPDNLSILKNMLDQYEAALLSLQLAVEILEKALGPDHPETAISLNNLAKLHQNLGRYDEALPLYQRAYTATLSGRVPETLKWVQANLGLFYVETGSIATAIFFLKGAVNTIQAIRTESLGLDKILQQSLLKTNEDFYTVLVDLLVETGRLDEALQVLSMLKEEEYFDFIRRDAQADARNTHMNYSGAEKSFADRLDKLSNDGAAQASQIIALLNELPQQLHTTLKQYTDEVSKENLSQLQVTLTSLGHGAVLLHYVVTDTRIRIILVTSKALLARVTEITAKDMYRKIIAFRQVQQNPARDPRPLAQEMYQLLIAPVADDLEQANAQTLMLSLNGSLRYLSIGALHDSEAYLVERYRLAMYTEVAKDKLREKPEPQWKVAGFGVTTKIGDFKPLPSVRQELDGIIYAESRKATGGVLPGDIYLDKDFTQARLHDVLDRAYPVLHIASHFVFIPGTESQSFLLLGDGKQLSLAELRTGEWKFGSVDMMTLSACETGVDGNGNGREIEGFGALVQRQGAKGVLATLWKVDDQSTAILMQALYRSRQEKHLTKAEALREAQLALISGKHVHPSATRNAPIINNAGAATVDAPIYTPDPAKPYAHPYYWAPFILMGNWL